jgi:hypothetical protein
MKKLYLDDERIPKGKGWDVVRNFEQFQNWILINGLPDVVSFDHDLGTDKNGTLKKNGVDCARWMCNYCIENGLPFLPDWNIHSANGVGAENIKSVLDTFNKMFT